MKRNFIIYSFNEYTQQFITKILCYLYDKTLVRATLIFFFTLNIHCCPWQRIQMAFSLLFHLRAFLNCTRGATYSQIYYKNTNLTILTISVHTRINQRTHNWVQQSVSCCVVKIHQQVTSVTCQCSRTSKVSIK